MTAPTAETTFLLFAVVISAGVAFTPSRTLGAIFRREALSSVSEQRIGVLRAIALLIAIGVAWGYGGWTFETLVGLFGVICMIASILGAGLHPGRPRKEPPEPTLASRIAAFILGVILVAYSLHHFVSFAR